MKTMGSRAYSQSADEEHPRQTDTLFGETESEQEDASRGRNDGICSQFKRPGLAWAILSGLIQSLHVILLSEVSSAMNPLQTTFLRSIFLLALVFFISWDEGENYQTQDLALNIAVGIIDLLGIAALLFATEFLPVSDVAAITNNQPIPSTIFACLLLGEAFDGLDGVLAIVNAIGLVLVCKTSVEEGSAAIHGLPFVGICFAFFALLCFILLKLIARKLAYRGRLDPSLVSFMIGCTGIVFSAAYLTVTSSWQMPSTQKVFLLTLALGVTALLHLYCFSKALKSENVIFIATALTLPIPATYFYDVMFKDIPVSAVTIIGVCLVLGSTFLLYIKSYLKEERSS